MLAIATIFNMSAERQLCKRNLELSVNYVNGIGITYLSVLLMARQALFCIRGLGVQEVESATVQSQTLF